MKLNKKEISNLRDVYDDGAFNEYGLRKVIDLLFEFILGERLKKEGESR